MNELYAEVREHLRQQQAANEQEICGKKVDNFIKYRYYGNSVDDEKMSSSGFHIMMKACIFFICVMLFSFYIYGGQDVKKGATMVWNEMKEQMIQLEQEEPLVQQAMSYVRKTYNEVEEFAKNHLNPGE